MPKKFDNNDPSTYPSDRDQRQRISSWDLILDTTIKSGTPEEKKEMRSYLREKYNDPDQRKHLGKRIKIYFSIQRSKRNNRCSSNNKKYNSYTYFRSTEKRS